MSLEASTLQMAFLRLPQAQSPAPGRVQNELAEGQPGMAVLITPSWDGLLPRWTVSPLKGQTALCSSSPSQPSNMRGEVMTVPLLSP